MTCCRTPLLFLTIFANSRKWFDLLILCDSEDDFSNGVGGVGVGEISQRGRIDELECCSLAAGDAAVSLTKSHGVGGVDGGGVDGLFRK